MSVNGVLVFYRTVTDQRRAVSVAERCEGAGSWGSLTLEMPATRDAAQAVGRVYLSERTGGAGVPSS